MYPAYQREEEQHNTCLGGYSMPKEQPCLSEHSPCATSSKNVKDERNSTTLLAMCETKDADDSSGRGSLSSSEKDSGYSDCSDWQHMDVEDQHSDKSQSGGSECAETSQPGQSREPGPRHSENSTLMLAGRELPPNYIINNMKQIPKPDTIQKKGQLLWRDKSWETGSSGAPPLIVLPTTRQPHKPLSRKPNITGKKRNGTYLPIFNSCSRIAPHPCKKPSDISSSNEKLQNLSENMCTNHKSDITPGNRSLLDQHLNKQPKAFSCSSSPRDTVSSSTSTIACSSQGSPSASTVHTTGSSSLLASRGHHRKGTSNISHRRFLNTLEILRQSGLLDIALRTKELLRQSNAIEQDISQLRQHTELLCQTASNLSRGLNGVTAWEPLHRAMSESCSYPNLELLHNLQTPPHPDSSGQPESINTGDSEQPATDSSDVSPAHCPPVLLDPNQNCPVSPHQSEQSRELVTGGKVTFTPPDSSTG
ncbi:CLOCK-interacting pacemaker isoform X1 [Pleuronectes platessa]|uniref:CLOCK-interacting pacemaker isoform X1 n=2 Tax=Pleuronectes platessa TaxID=8262 RepID=UPI00232A3A20|nr:CLOCK-interacting pacemaker isoform X1 [Pleuronectes platessa]XP_053279132.1 CLOCK-interacting pacemaker isoform X1 [Pleuronectes platessa]